MLWLFLFLFLIRVNIFAFEIYFLSTLNITYTYQKLNSCKVLNSILSLELHIIKSLENL